MKGCDIYYCTLPSTLVSVSTTSQLCKLFIEEHSCVTLRSTKLKNTSGA